MTGEEFAAASEWRWTHCWLCGASVLPLQGGWHVMLQGTGRGGHLPTVIMCEQCLMSASVAAVLTSAERWAEEQQRYRDQYKFEKQAAYEAEVLARDPALCAEVVTVRVPVPGRPYTREAQRFCSRKASHPDGFCTQHHEMARS